VEVRSNSCQNYPYHGNAVNLITIITVSLMVTNNKEPFFLFYHVPAPDAAHACH
jgi:hypothetical protein